MAVKNYGIHDKWTDLDKLNNVDIKSVDGVIESVKINGEEAGGGSSDFSTAQVTLTNETMFALALAYTDNTNGVSSHMGPSGVYDVVLYKGKAKGTLLAPSANASVTGNITYNDYEFVITGDGTITISE